MAGFLGTNWRYRVRRLVAMVTAALLILLIRPPSPGFFLGVGILAGLLVLELGIPVGRRYRVAPSRVARTGMWAGVGISALGGLAQLLWLVGLGAGIMFVCLREWQSLYRAVGEEFGKKP